MTEAVTGRASSQRFPSQHRLRKRPEFLALQRQGQRRSTHHFIVITRGKQAPPSRLGITTSRKVGNAPVRNRIRRLVREFFRRRQVASGQPRDILVIARPRAVKLGYGDVERELTQALGVEIAS